MKTQYQNQKIQKRIARHRRIRAKISGTDSRPRLSVFRSNSSLYGQVINDDKGLTIVAISDGKMKGKTKTERAKLAGAELAKLAKEKKVVEVVFDRGGYIYTGRVKAFADGAKEGGLKF